jgi:antibiotic biosynthesis monooxygenase (ABM) superfamily enzyme
MSDESKSNGEQGADAAGQVKTMDPAKATQDSADIMQKYVKAKDGMPSLVTKFLYPAGFDTATLGPKVVDMLMVATNEPGFLNAEIVPPEHSDVHEWLLIQRFRSPEQTDSWRESTKRQEAVKALAASLPGVTCTDDVSSDAPRGNVVTAIVTDVKEGKEAAYKEWETRVQAEQTNAPGYRGAYLQPPILGAKHAQWTTLLRFDSPDNLEKWFDSDARHKLVDEGNGLVKKVDFLKITGSFPGWFPSDASGEAIPNWKGAMLVLLGLFPIVMSEIKWLAPVLRPLNPAVGNILSLSLSVAGTSFVTMPLFIPPFKWWLLPGADAPASTHVKGALVVLALYGLEILIMWNLLP